MFIWRVIGVYWTKSKYFSFLAYTPDLVRYYFSSPLAARWKTVSRSLIANPLESVGKQNKIYLSFLFLFLLCRLWTDRTLTSILLVIAPVTSLNFFLRVYVSFFLCFPFLLTQSLHSSQHWNFRKFLFLFIRINSISISRYVFKNSVNPRDHYTTLPYIPLFLQTASMFKDWKFVVHYWISVCSCGTYACC